MCYFYNNEFGSNEGADSNGIEYGETTTYAKRTIRPTIRPLS